MTAQPDQTEQPELLSELFEARVRESPHAPALRYVPRQGVVEETSYAELNAAANRRARLLAQRGAGPERLVALALPRGPDLVVSLLAVAKCGAASMPLDVDQPAARIAELIALARPALVLDRSLRDQAAGLPDGNLPRPARPAHPAYVIHTSGSTGAPKGVVVSHTGIPVLTRLHRDLLGAGPGARVLQYASPAFDAAIWEVCLALLTGATLVVAPSADLRPGAGLAEFVAAERITHLTLTPSALALITDPAALRSVEVLVAAGERLAPATARRWAAGRVLVNAYGPTEATVCATVSDALTGTENPSVPIGRPIPGTGAYVLGPGLEPVPPGVTGELYLAGPALARGYLDRPALTSTRFVADPFGLPGERMYRTGDLARWDGSGLLHFAGRTDDQVQVNGCRVEPAETEAVLARHPEVGQAAVTVREEAAGARLVGHAVALAGARLTPAHLRAWLAERLPGHLVPVAVRILDELPLTSSGKVDRARLTAGDAPRRAPVGADERLTALCAVAAEVLGVSEVDPQDNFFELGGSSMDAVALVSRAGDVLGLDLAVTTVFEQQTMAGVNGSLDRERQAPRRAEPAGSDVSSHPAASEILAALFPGRAGRPTNPRQDGNSHDQPLR